ncbi:MAG: MFS transporter [Prevotellaceae bacterium]|jgi:MFS family permease|nr:MFS transporter [Prevotellaceae bacterium]
MKYGSSHTRRWYRVSVSAFYFAQGLVYASWTSRIPDIKRALEMSDAQLGTALLLLPIGEFVTMMLSGYMVSRFGSRRMLLIAACCYPLTLMAVGMASSRAALYAVLFVFGAAANLSNIAVNTQAVGVERLYGRSIMGVFHGVWSLAGFVGALLGMLMATCGALPWQHFATVSVLIWALVALMHRSTLPRDAHQQHMDNAPTKIFSRPEPYILLVGVVAFANMVCEGTVFNWSVLFFEDVVHAPASVTRLGYVAAMCSMALGRFTVDRFINRYGPITVMRLGGATIVAGLLLTVAHPTLLTSTLGFLLIGAGISPTIPICYSLAGRSRRMLPGVALATVSSVSFFGMFLGPPAIGFISNAMGLRVAVCLMGVFGLLVVGLSVGLKKRCDVR